MTQRTQKTIMLDINGKIVYNTSQYHRKDGNLNMDSDDGDYPANTEKYIYLLYEAYLRAFMEHARRCAFLCFKRVRI